MELEELHEKIKKPKRIYVLMQADVDGWHLYMEKRVDAVSKQDAWHQIQHRLESANDKFVDLSELHWRVQSINVIGPSKSTQRARRLAAKNE